MRDEEEVKGSESLNNAVTKISGKAVDNKCHSSTEPTTFGGHSDTEVYVFRTAEQ